MLRGLVIVTVTLSILVATPFLFYHSVTLFFGIDDVDAQVRLMWLFAVIGLSFPFAALLAFGLSNIVTRLLYLVSAVLFGFGMYFLMATGLAWAIYGISVLVAQPLDMAITYAILTGFALFVTLFGLLRAFHLRVNHLDVEIANLPPQWDGKTVVHLSDIHLGPIYRNGFVRRITSKIAEIDPELVLITGDLFDGACPDPFAFVEALDELDAQMGVFFAMGNHEGYLRFTRPFEALKKTRIRVLDDELVEIDGLQIVGIGYPDLRTGKLKRNPFVADSYSKRSPTILLHHTPTSVNVSFSDAGTQQVDTYLSPDTDFQLQIESGVDLQLSGHTHAGQIFPFNVLTKRLFNGYDAGLHHVGDFAIFTSAGTGTWGPPIRTAGDSEIVAIRLVAKA